jgi:undecaprenyl pyrophosphate phosphatase UppP
MKAYKKEVRFTIWMSVAFILAGNVGLFFSMFPVDAYLFGFPVMYIVPILMGWFGVFFLTLVAGRIGNRIDDEIDRENGELVDSDDVKGA